RARPPAEPGSPARRRGAQQPPVAPERAENPAAALPAHDGRRAQAPAAPAPFEQPATTALPTARRGTPPPATPEPPATSALPTARGRRRAQPPQTPQQPEHAAPTGRRRAAPPAAPELPQPPATTALPTAGGPRRAQPPAAPEQPERAAPPGRRRPPPPAAPEPAGHAAPGARRRVPQPAAATEPPEPGATTALPAAAGRGYAPPDAPAEAPAARRRARRSATAEPPEDPVTGDPPADSASRTRGEGDARTRALRIDETLTRLTAAHAGLTLAVSDGRDEPAAPPPRRRLAVSAGRLLAGALAVAVVAATAFGWGTKTWLGSAVADADALDPESGAIVDAAVQSGDENVLVVATEPNADPAAPRADTVAIAHIPETGGPVTVLGFPNDLEINRPPCESWDPATGTYGETEPAEPRTRLVSALDVGGPRCLTRVMQQLTGIAVTKYVGTDLGAVPALTEAVGGAEVCVPRPVLDGVLGPVVPDAGTQQLAGVRAADFVQAGEVAGDPSPEYGRIQRQQQVLAAVLDEAVSGTALLDIGRITALRPALSDAVVVDGAGLDQVLALAMTLRRLDAEGVRYAGVPTAERNNRGNLVLRDTRAAELFEAVRTDAPLPAEATDPGAADTGPTPSDVTVEVFNASDRSGLAGEVGETLNSLGFGVGDVANAEQPTSETVIRFSPDQAAAAELLAATVPSATSVPDPGATGVLHLVLGRSFDDVVRAPSEPIALAAPATLAPEEPPVSCA
ncbi:MAG TPA: LCP family protein, partial [Pseudonocardia sp.]|nr:LCP family protein [Pseudonocardia sp.]